MIKFDNNSRFISAFALPTVMITSVIMIIVLLMTLQISSTATSSLRAQYYNQLARSAAESGLAMAEACINSGVSAWANPLRPNSGCNGSATQCTDDDNCWVVKTSKYRTTFAINSPSSSGDLSSLSPSGNVELFRTSDGASYKTYSQSIKRTDQQTMLTWKEVSVGNSHSCAIASNNQVYCWGDNTYGQLGNGTTESSGSPVAVNMSGVLSGKTVLQVDAGGTHTCVLASDNQAYCWGSNTSGKLGNNSTTTALLPVAVTRTGVLSGKTIRQISAANQHTCAIASDNLAYCWGNNGTGRLGNNSTTSSSVPVAVNTSGVLSGKTIRYIATGNQHSCAIASDNLAYCWGYNGSGRLGNNSTTDSYVPVAVVNTGAMSGNTFRYIDVGGRT